MGGSLAGALAVAAGLVGVDLAHALEQFLGLGHGQLVVVTLGAIFGALSGGLLGRGLALLRLTRPEASAAGAAAA